MSAKFIAEFSTIVENISTIEKMDGVEIIGCNYGKVIGDVSMVVVLDSLEAAIKLPFKSYHDDKEQSELCGGGLKIWKNFKDYSSFRCVNRKEEILFEYFPDRYPEYALVCSMTN